MRLSIYEGSWHMRLFFWSVGIWDEFCETETADKYKDGTNLCHFVRVICVYMPLVLLVHAAVLVAGILTLTWLPIHLFGGPALASASTSVGEAAILIIAMFLVVRFCNERDTVLRSRVGQVYAKITVVWFV